MGLPVGRDAAAHRVGRQVEDVHVAAGRQHHGVADVAAQLAADQVADRDALGLAVHHHQVQHLGAGEHLDRAEADLAGEGRVGAQQELLAGLASRVEGAGDLGAAEGPVVQVAGVVPRERHALGHALVDDVVADLGEPPDVGLAGAEVAALDGVVEEAVDAVAVVRVGLGGVDAALGRDRVGAAGAVLVAERLHLVAQLGQRGRRRGAGQAGADDEDLVLPLVGRVDQLQRVEAVLVPGVLDLAGRCLTIEDHGCSPYLARRPTRKSTGIAP